MKQSVNKLTGPREHPPAVTKENTVKITGNGSTNVGDAIMRRTRNGSIKDFVGDWDRLSHRVKRGKRITGLRSEPRCYCNGWEKPVEKKAID